MWCFGYSRHCNRVGTCSLYAICILLVGLTSFSSRGLAQTPSAKSDIAAKTAQKEAELLTKKADALQAKKRGNDAKSVYRQALAQWQIVIESGNSVVAALLAAAAIENRLGEYDAAARRLYPLLSTGSDASRQAAQKVYDESVAQLGIITLVVSPAQCVVMLDGKNLGTTPLAVPLVLTPGKYMIELLADGYEPKKIELEVEAGTESERKVSLVAIAEVSNNETAQPVASQRPSVKPVADSADSIGQPPTKYWLYAGVTLTVAGAATATAFAVIAKKKYNIYQDSRRDTVERESARKTGKKSALYADIAIGTTAVAALGTLAYYFLSYNPRVRELESAWWIAPDVGNGGIAAGGSF
jgi:hypothetical protein